jgi:vancomycin permeability regulator SanA
MFLSLFTMVNLVGDGIRPGFDANIWWIDLRWLPHSVAEVLLTIAAVFVLGFAVSVPRRGFRKLATITTATLMAAVTSANALNCMVLFIKGAVHSGVPCPLSLPASLFFIAIARLCFRAPECEGRRLSRPRLWPAAAACIVCGLILPLAQMFFFGKTDYRRRADVTVVLGARVYADGHLSDALADRVRTACELYRRGLTSKLLMSGGPGDGAIDEPTAMKQMALSLGVSEKAILLDHNGLNTELTIHNTEKTFRELKPERVMVVSHFYHLPRIKMAYARAGRNVYTVPARESYLLRQMPFNMAREVAAIWVYYFRPLSGTPKAA